MTKSTTSRHGKAGQRRGVAMGRIAIVVSLAFVSACASARGSSGAAGAASPMPASRAFPNDLRWFRTSAEYRALARQAYHVAEERMPELSRGLASGAWGVILDADETVLDNSEYQRRRFTLDSNYTDASWTAWVNERAAATVPGALELTRRVHALGGRVVIVTNRAEAVCGPTRENLRANGIVADLVLCQPPGESDKNPRFRRVQSGTAAPGFAALTIVAWFGDNILDFPGLSQASRQDSRALAEFGARYFILPNPMYGSWSQNPPR